MLMVAKVPTESTGPQTLHLLEMIQLTMREPGLGHTNT